MQKKLNILFTDLIYLNHNYGAQGIAFPLMDKLKEYFDVEPTFLIHKNYYKEDFLFSRKNNFKIIESPNSLVVLGNKYFLIRFLYKLFYLIKRRKKLLAGENKKNLALLENLKKSDAIIDLSGIEFIGNVKNQRRKWSNYINKIYMQSLAEKLKKPYFKYTKSYGPISGKIYTFFVKRKLKKLPFIFVRGRDNLEEIKKLKLKVPLYSFPDVSIALKPADKNWAVDYVKKIGIDISKPIIGISPSSVITDIKTNTKNSSSGKNHIKLCNKLIDFFQKKGLQVLLIPHSLGDGKDITSCDLALAKKIYSNLPNKENVFLISDRELTYSQARSIVGLFNFYIAARYHAVASALSMAIPVVSLSWHIKYKDIMSLFLDDFLTVDCRKVNINKAFSLIEKYYNDQKWFDKEKVLKRKENVIKKIDKSISLIVNEIKK